MLRMYCLQQWYGLADEALEDALYDSQALRDFVGIDLSHESVPDATTLLKFRRLLNDNNLTRALFDEINAHLGEKGLLMRAGTIVDATIIAAPSSTKNEDKARDPKMHQAKKGNQWHFGMKAHIGVDAESGLVHSLVATAANVNDVTQAGALLHGKEGVAFGDAGYRGVSRRSSTLPRDELINSMSGADSFSANAGAPRSSSRLGSGGVEKEGNCFRHLDSQTPLMSC
jgi:IS5 family transposase